MWPAWSRGWQPTILKLDCLGRRYTAAVNRAYAAPDRVLADGDEVGLIPPVSGGS